MDVVGPLLGLVQCLFAPVIRQFNHLRSLKDNVEILREKMEELSARENDVKAQLSSTVVQLRKQPKSEVQVWLKNVEKVTAEFHLVEEKIVKKRRCIKGCFPDFRSNLKLSKSARESTKRIIDLQEKGLFIEGVLVNSVPNSGRILPSTVLVGKTTSKKFVGEIWDCLMNEEIGRIGVYGMGGVGKTTIMTHINNRLKEEQYFDDVIWVTISKSSNLRKLQGDIAKAVDLNITSIENEDHRASELYECLLQRKKFVLILDDMQCKFPLEKVGVPSPSRENGCKIVLTTRLKEVCRGMETEIQIKVEVLTDGESWELFTNKVGKVVTSSPDIEPIAKLVAEECCGLPLAIITVARAMRDVHDIRVWRNALEELRSSWTEIEGMKEEVFARLRFSYNRLKNDRTRACFLYCALYPKEYDIDVEELIEYWMAEGLINEVRDREKEIDKGYAILSDLKDACLMEVSTIAPNRVRMHDLVRDLAISITREIPRFVIKSGIGLKRLRNEEEWENDVEKMSFMENNIEVLYDKPMCPKLSTLLLQRNPLLQNIPDSFFDYMSNLRVLDLSETQIETLPISVSNLVNLRALLLRSCDKLETIPSLAKLTVLRVLDLSSTLIRQLEQESLKLVNLRRLDLSHTENLEIFPCGSLAKLIHLENLSMYKSKWRWSLDVTKSGGASIEEITSSTQINNLGLSFEDITSFSTYIKFAHWSQLRSFHLGVGLLSSFPSVSRRINSIEIEGCKLSNYKDSMVLPDNTLQLAIQGCHDINHLSELSCLSSLKELKECYISRCKTLKYFVVPVENILPSLQRLILRRLPRFVAICGGVLPHGNLSSLKAVHVHCCSSLQHLFSFDMLLNLQNLEEIEVWNCNLIEEIVAGVGKDGLNLPRLQRLYLSSLPALKSICKRMIFCKLIQSINVWSCPKLKKLPLFIEDTSHNLQEIKGSRNWWDSLEWNDPKDKAILETVLVAGEASEGEEGEDDIVEVLKPNP